MALPAASVESFPPIPGIDSTEPVITTGSDGPADNQRRSLRRNFSWMLMGIIIYSGCQWVMVMVLAKLTNPEQVGLFALGLAVTAPIILFAGMQMRAIQATDSRELYRFGDYLTFSITSIALALLVIGGIALALVLLANRGYALSGHSDYRTSLVILLLGIAKAIEAMSELYYGLFQQHERMHTIAISMTIKGLLSFLTFTICVLYTRSILWGCMVLAISWLTVFSCYDIPRGVRLLKELKQAQYHEFLSLHWDSQLLHRLFRLAFPLGIVIMLISLSGYIPRYFLASYQGKYAVGIFSALYYILTAGMMVICAIGQSVVPRLARMYANQQRKAFWALLLKLQALVAVGSIAVIIVAIFFGFPLLRLLFKQEYAVYHHVFVLMMIAAGIQYVASLLGYAMTAARIFTPQLPLLLTVTLVSSLASWWLIPHASVVGATYSVMITAGVMLVGSLLVMRRTLPQSRPANQEGGLQ